ncbi:isoaspartyl peptidase/L-asparaginase family protein [Lichenicoccus sp.]|uniref:isoaspartyl peptidase/L-asparaginase family protein n=1 Tax=Lichenicoccus sp. TaxID=2781899 RepID=UPI003D0FED4A
MTDTQHPIAIGLHGGCGVMAQADLPEAEWTAARADIAVALRAGWDLLCRGASAVDAVEACVVVLEDSPHFNAGHGAALNRDGVHELDAAIMDGASAAAGAVCAAQAIRNPVRAARALMRQGVPMMLAGPAADRFAASVGLALEGQEYFTTPRRLAALRTMRERRAAGTASGATEAEKHGTVGAVALDQDGHLAAATSTGGYTDKPEGRIGDSPVIGAGTYARDGVCAVSCTGQGEFFIRQVAAHEIGARMRYLGENLDTATRTMIETELAPHGIGAGLIAIDRYGRIAAPFNTEGMFRGWMLPDGTMFVATHR